MPACPFCRGDRPPPHTHTPLKCNAHPGWPGLSGCTACCGTPWPTPRRSWGCTCSLSVQQAVPRGFRPLAEQRCVNDRRLLAAPPTCPGAKASCVRVRAPATPPAADSPTRRGTTRAGRRCPVRCAAALGTDGCPGLSRAPPTWSRTGCNRGSIPSPGSRGPPAPGHRPVVHVCVPPAAATAGALTADPSGSAVTRPGAAASGRPTGPREPNTCAR